MHVEVNGGADVTRCGRAAAATFPCQQRTFRTVCSLAAGPHRVRWPLQSYPTWRPLAQLLHPGRHLLLADLLVLLRLGLGPQPLPVTEQYALFTILSVYVQTCQGRVPLRK